MQPRPPLFLKDLLRNTIRVSVKSLQQAAQRVKWLPTHGHDVAYVLNNLYSKCRLVEKNKRTWERVEETNTNMEGVVQLASLFHVQPPPPSNP
eukprot:4929506-Amphidinium_carterae.1